jgi:hypothetical protein
VAYSEPAGRRGEKARRSGRAEATKETTSATLNETIFFFEQTSSTHAASGIARTRKKLSAACPSHATHSLTTKHPSTPVLRTHERGRQQLAPFVRFQSAPSKEALFFTPPPAPKAFCCERNTGDFFMVQSKRRDLWGGRGRLPAQGSIPYALQYTVA